MDTSEDVQMEDESMMEIVYVRNVTTNLTYMNEAYYTHILAKIKIIMSRETPIHLTLQFMYTHDRYEILEFLFTKYSGLALSKILEVML